MKRVVIAGSSKLRKEINYWLENFKNKGYKILDYPKKIDRDNFMHLYPNIHKEFFENIAHTDILFIMNEDKNGIVGYIGAESYAELAFGLAQNLVYNKNIQLIIYKMPSMGVHISYA